MRCVPWSVHPLKVRSKSFLDNKYGCFRGIIPLRLGLCVNKMIQVIRNNTWKVAHYVIFSRACRRPRNFQNRWSIHRFVGYCRQGTQMGLNNPELCWSQIRSEWERLIRGGTVGFLKNHGQTHGIVSFSTDLPPSKNLSFSLKSCQKYFVV